VKYINGVLYVHYPHKGRETLEWKSRNKPDLTNWTFYFDNALFSPSGARCREWPASYSCCALPASAAARSPSLLQFMTSHEVNIKRNLHTAI